MKKMMLKKFINNRNIKIFLFTVIANSLFLAQTPVTYTAGPTNAQINTMLQGNNVTISGGTLNLGVRNRQIATFTGGIAAGLSMADGVYLTTGDITKDLTATTFTLSEPSGSGGKSINAADADLNTIDPTCTFDVASYSFNVTMGPKATSLYIAYQFGSEEYPNFVGSVFDDAFGFFVSGPGIAGTANLARLPNGQPTSINKVNIGIPGRYSPIAGPVSAYDNTQTALYINNGHTVTSSGSRLEDNDAPTATRTTQVAAVAMSGLTKLISYSVSGLKPGATYTFKIAIGDNNDGDYDSGVFIDQIYATNSLDSDGDGFIDLATPDIDSDNDGILDSVENGCTAQFDAGWFSDSPAGTKNQDGLWANAPTGTPTYGGAHNTNVVGSASPFTFGAGFIPTQNGSRWDIASIDAISLDQAVVNNEYVEYPFTTANPGIFSSSNYVYIQRLGMAQWNLNHNYYYSVAVSNDNFATNTIILRDKFMGQTTGNPYNYIVNTDISEYYKLLANTSYKIRVYLYNVSGGPSQTITYDDFQFGTCAAADADGDGVPNFLDLDSDNDGCPDAIEGTADIKFSQLVNSAGAVTVGTGSTSANVNLCANPYTGTATDCVNSQGLPQITPLPTGYSNTTGQGAGSAYDAAVNVCKCFKGGATGGTVLDTKHGITALGRAGANNGNWPMVRKGAWTALEAKSKGFVVNRVAFSAGNPVGIPAANFVEGMLVYDSTNNCLKMYTSIDNGVTFGWYCISTQTCPDVL